MYFDANIIDKIVCIIIGSSIIAALFTFILLFIHLLSSSIWLFTI